MQLGIFAKTFAAQGAGPVLAAVRNAGFETAQFNMSCLALSSMPDEISAETTASIVAASRQAGVSIAAVSATYNMIHPDPNIRASGMKRLAVIMAAARSMGTRLVTLCTGTRDALDQWRAHPDNQTPKAWADLLHELEKAIVLAEKYGVDLGIEPELANVVNSATAAKRLLTDLPSQHLRIVLDPANLFEVETDARRRDIVAAAVDLLGPQIAMAHIKDRDATGRFAAAGAGVIDFRHFVRALRDAKFTGSLVTHGLSEAEAPSVARFLTELLVP